MTDPQIVAYRLMGMTCVHCHGFSGLKGGAYNADCLSRKKHVTIHSPICDDFELFASLVEHMNLEPEND